MREFIEHKVFNRLIDITIFLNTVLLAYDRYPGDMEIEKILEYVNLIFFSIFFVEMILKLVVYGFKEYAESKFNLFDAFVVGISTIDILVNFLVTS